MLYSLYSWDKTRRLRTKHRHTKLTANLALRTSQDYVYIEFYLNIDKKKGNVYEIKRNKNNMYEGETHFDNK